jgi:hypothetical protein
MKKLCKYPSKAAPLFLALLATLPPAIPGYAQEAPPGKPAEQADDRLEEVIVYGQKPLWRLRRDIELAENRFYDLFNELNDDPKLRVTCSNEASTGSHVRKRICRTQLELDLLEAEAEGQMRLGSIGRRGQLGGGTLGDVRYANRLLREKMASMAEENEDMLRALLQIGIARQMYETEKERRCEEDSSWRC